MNKLEKIDNDFLSIYNSSKKTLLNMDRSESLLVANHEDIRSFMKKVSGFFIKKVNDVASLFSSNSKNNTKNLSRGIRLIIKDLEREDKNVVKIAALSPESFDIMKKIIVPWIPGIDVTYPELIKSIETHIINISTTGIKLLEEADTYISKLSSDEEFRMSMIPNKDFINRLKDYNKVTTGYLESMINGKKIKDNIELGEILPDGKSFLDSHNILKGIIGYKDIDSVQNIFDMSGNIAKRTNELHDTLVDGNLAISRTKVKEMPVILKESAQLVTNCAALLRLLDAATRVHMVLLSKLVLVVK